MKEFGLTAKSKINGARKLELHFCNVPIGVVFVSKEYIKVFSDGVKIYEEYL